jgi:molecular chaperone GrpE
MSSETTSNEELVDSIDAEEMPSVDDFIKELEAKEKDLQISSDLVIEVGESSVEHDNIHDSFVSASFSASPKEKTDAKDDDEEERQLREIAARADDVELQLKEQIEELISERDDLMDVLRRQKIDFENYRSRTERDREHNFTNFLSGIATQILPIIDNLERALDSTVENENPEALDISTFLQGVVLVNQQMNEVLVDLGVEPIRAKGEPFDPNFHDAVDCVATDHVPPRTVIEELSRGYRIGDRVVRPSMVKVSEAPKEPAETDSEDNMPHEEPTE